VGYDEISGEAIQSENVLEVKDKYNVAGTIAKSQMLVDMHPDVARMVFRYGRWHHHVDYSSFRKLPLIYKDGIVIPKGVNNYGLRLITNWSE
jgi:hypothetical protein